MAKIIFITGGQRSGKSSYAQKLARELTKKPVYIATARTWDDDFNLRIEKHKSDRDNNWINIEKEKDLSNINIIGKVAVVDCITLWLTNFFSDENFNSEKALELAKDEWNQFISQDATIIAISNEIGMGVHGTTKGVRDFTDIHGWMNQHIAKTADEVYLMVSGIPVKIK